MGYKQLERIEVIDQKIATIRHTLKTILPIWNALDLRKQSLDHEVKTLLDERDKINQGQLQFNEEF